MTPNQNNLNHQNGINQENLNARNSDHTAENKPGQETPYVRHPQPDPENRQIRQNRRVPRTAAYSCAGSRNRTASSGQQKSGNAKKPFTIPKR